MLENGFFFFKYLLQIMRGEMRRHSGRRQNNNNNNKNAVTQYFCNEKLRYNFMIEEVKCRFVELQFNIYVNSGMRV